MDVCMEIGVSLPRLPLRGGGCWSVTHLWGGTCGNTWKLRLSWARIPSGLSEWGNGPGPALGLQKQACGRCSTSWHRHTKKRALFSI